MNIVSEISVAGKRARNRVTRYEVELFQRLHVLVTPRVNRMKKIVSSERGDVPGWVLVVLMTTGLVTGIWTVAQPRLSSILKNSLDNMNSIR